MSTAKPKSKPSTKKPAPKRPITPAVAVAPPPVPTKFASVLASIAGMTPAEVGELLALHFTRKSVAGIPVTTSTTEYEHAMPSGGSITMIRIAGGTFARGGDKYDDEKNGGTVTMSAYSLAKYPTTRGQFAAFVSATSHITTAEKESDSRTWRDPKFPRPQTDDHPVVCVSHDDAVAFAAWAGLSLPTEAQWEYAARGTDGRAYPWGNDAPTGRDDARLHWMADMTCPVGTHPAGASPFGVHDMAGNVWEWTADWFANYDPAVTTDPTGPTTGTSRVLRGGSWGIYVSVNVRAAFRDWSTPLNHWISDGFRCARGV